MSERSLCVYIMTSMVEYVFFWRDDRLLSHCGYAEVLSCEEFYRGMYSFLYLEWFQLTWGSLITAIIFSVRFAAEWYVQIWIWYQKQTFWLKRLNLSSIFVTVITARDDLVPYWGVPCSIGKHCFSFSGNWGIWPFLVLCTMMMQKTSGQMSTIICTFCLASHVAHSVWWSDLLFWFLLLDEMYRNIGFKPSQHVVDVKIMSVWSASIYHVLPTCSFEFVFLWWSAVVLH